MCNRQDDRTAEQRVTHLYLIIMTDSFMSGWGGARGGTSVAAWACRAEDVHEVDTWVRSRREAKRVRFADERRRRYYPKAAAHFHVYVVEDGHPALEERRS